MRSVNRTLFVLLGLLGLVMFVGRSFPPGFFGGGRNEQSFEERPMKFSQPTKSVFVKKATWKTRCSAETEQKSHCQIQRTVLAPNRESALLQIMIARGVDEKGARGLVIVPADVHRPSGVAFQPQDGIAQKLDYLSCTKKNCIASLSMDDALVEQLKSASRLDIRFVMRDRKSVGVAVDLKGFAEAYEDLK
jgi:invasion protein IalB